MNLFMCAETLMEDGEPVPAESGSTKSRENNGVDQPDREIKFGSVKLVVWENESSDGGRFHTFQFSRNYQDSSGDWKETGSMRVRDLPHIISCVRRAIQIYGVSERIPGVNKDEEDGGGEREKAEHMLTRGSRNQFEDDDFVEKELLSKYIYYAQRIYPVLTEDATEMVKDAYINLFEAQDPENNFVKPRHCNALAILSIAFARMDLSNEVTEKHVTSAFDFFKKCYTSIDFEIGKNDLADLEGQNTKKMRKIRNYFKTDEREKIEVQELVEELDMDEEDVESVINQLKREGELYDPEPGIVQMV